MAELIIEDGIILDATAKNKDEAIALIASTMNKLGRVKDEQQLVRDLYLREDEASTSMGMGVAIPHAKSSAVTEPTLIMLRLEDQIVWDNDDNIQMVFGILVPEANVGNVHLQILSHLARKLVDEEYREQVLAETNPAKLVALLS